MATRGVGTDQSLSAAAFIGFLTALPENLSRQVEVLFCGPPPALGKAACRQPLGGFIVLRFVAIAVLHGVVIEGEQGLAAASLLRLAAPPFVGQKMVKCREQEGPEAAFVAIHRPQETLLKQPLEESLRQVLRLVRFMSATPDMGIERIPIGAAQTFQRFIRSFRIVVGRREDNAPMGGEKTHSRLR